MPDYEGKRCVIIIICSDDGPLREDRGFDEGCGGEKVENCCEAGHVGQGAAVVVYCYRYWILSGIL